MLNMPIKNTKAVHKHAHGHGHSHGGDHGHNHGHSHGDPAPDHDPKKSKEMLNETESDYDLGIEDTIQSLSEFSDHCHDDHDHLDNIEEKPLGFEVDSALKTLL
jgi:hypothetical protein